MDYSHGVVYTPQNVQRPLGDLRALEDPSICADLPTLPNASERVAAYVRIYWVDFVNIRRCRLVPIEHFKALLKSNRPGVNIAKVCFGLVYLMTAPGFLPIGEYIYTIDITTLKPCPFAPGHMAVLGQFEEKTPVQGTDGNPTVAVDLCPRTLLRRMVEEAKKSHKTEFLVGFETEFILLKTTDPVEPANVHDWSSSAGLLAGSAEATVVQEIADAITASGIVLELFHSEAAPGQYEVATGPLAPLEAADAVVHTREIIVQVAAKHGLHATLAPRPFMTSAGSSAHAHISVHSQAAQKTADGLSTHESAFLAGVLEHLPAITAFTLPTTASYARMMDGVWSGGTYVCYGTENREAPIRLTNATSPASRNFEIRFIDGTANPHLALAAVLAGGLIGLQEMLELKMGDCRAASAAEMTASERQTLGITQRMPLNLDEARRNLEQDSVLGGMLGRDLISSYLSVNKTLEAALVQDGESEAQQLTRLVKFY
ncbi:glutamine synthetase guanido kinase [Mycena galopus ATCC 62051]|nr:glutamine synthetase guanido kinase [Mycena galopus ATCC 62051]